MAESASTRSTFDFFQLHEFATVPQLANYLDLPSSTVVGLVNRLVRSRLLYRSESLIGKRGRPTQVYRLRLPGAVAACEIDGSRISVAVFDRQLQLLSLVEKSFPRSPAATEARRTAADLLRGAIRQSRLRSRDILAVITSLNAVAIDDRAISSSVLPWAESQTGGLVELAGVPVHLTISPNVVSEYRKLESKPSSLCLLRAGDGVSARLIGNGRLLKGAHSLGGQLGHIPVDPNGPICGCGRRGCLETYCSGPAIVQQAIAGLNEGPLSELNPADLAAQPPAEAIERIYRAWKNGDSFARAMMDAVLDRLAWGMGIVVDLLDPAMIAAGGYVLSGRAEWIEDIARRSQRWILHAGKRSLPIASATASIEDDLRTLASQMHWLTVVDNPPAKRKRRTRRTR